MNADTLDGVVDSTVSIVVPEGSGQPHACTSPFLREVIAQEPVIAVVQIHCETQLFVKKEGLLEGNHVILVPATGGDLQPEFLPPPGEKWRVEKVKVALCITYLGVERHDRAVAETHHDIAGAALGHPDDEVSLAGQLLNLLGLGLHLIEQPGTLEAAFAQVDADHVERFARVNVQLTPDDLVLGGRVAPDLDLLHLDRFVLRDPVVDVDFAGAGIRDDLGAYVSVQITLHLIQLLYGEGILLTILGRKDFAWPKARAHVVFKSSLALKNLCVSIDRVPLEGDVSHAVLVTLENIEANDHPVPLFVQGLDFVHQSKVDVTMGLVEFLQLLHVGVPLILLEFTAAGQPRHPPMTARFQNLAQLPLRKGKFFVISGRDLFKNDVVDLHPLAGFDPVSDDDLPLVRIMFRQHLHHGLMIAGLVVFLLDDPPIRG